MVIPDKPKKKRVFSDETRKKMSESAKKKKLSPEHKANIAKATKKRWENGDFDSPEIRASYSKQGKSTKGSKRTDEQRQKMSESRRGRDVSHLHTSEAIEKRRIKLLGKKQSLESNKKRSIKLKGRDFSDEHKKKLSESGRRRTDYRGENSRWWRGGNYNNPYPDVFEQHLKQRIRRQYGYRCQCCGADVYRSRFGHVHHIDGNKQNCSEENLVLVCQSCHNGIHRNSTLTNDKIEFYKSKLMVELENRQ